MPDPHPDLEREARPAWLMEIVELDVLAHEKLAAIATKLAQDLADAEQQIEELREAGQTLANIAASAVCEPRRFYENEDDHQNALGLAVAQFRSAALDKSAEKER